MVSNDGMETTKRPARTVAIVSDRGAPIYVSEGSARQEGDLKLYACNGCQRHVVWATSNRTGRKYLVNVYGGGLSGGMRYYVKASAHQCDKPFGGG